MPKKTTPNRLVAYYRYSGGSGQTEQSIEGQRRDCVAWAKSHGLTIDAEYILDPVKLEQIVDRILAMQQHEPQPNPETAMLEAELAENFRKQDNILKAIEDGAASARLSARLLDLEDQAADLRRRLADIEAPVPAPVFDRDQLLFMLEQFRRAPDEQDENYKRRLIDTFIHAIYLTDESAFVQFNISSSANNKSTTLESVVLSLLHGDPDENTDVLPSEIPGFDHVSFGGADGSRTRVRKEIS